MSTIPPEGTGTTTTTTGTTGRGGYGLGNMPMDVARLPIPGNAEFVVYLIAVIILWLVCWISDSLGAAQWTTFFTVLTAFYILSRGIAKASRVLEQ
jgi:hypothetical protein